MTEKIYPPSSWNLPPTFQQTRSITKLATALEDKGEGPIPIEHTPSNRREARDLIYKLRIQLKEKNRVDIT